jgi:hypothetical protein
MNGKVGRGIVGGVMAAALVAAIGGWSGSHAMAAARAAKPAVVHVTTLIKTGKMMHRPGWPKYTRAFWTVRKGDTVVLTIKSYDDGTAPLSKDSPYGQVLGTVNGKEFVNGKAVTRIPDQDVAHTFTVPALGLNVVVPAARPHGFVTVVATFKVTKAGVFDWQCEAPCGTTASGWGGPMLTPGWMQGAITVKA